VSAEHGVGLRWLEEAAATYRGGGSHTTATTQAAIGIGFLLLELLDRLEVDPVNAAIAQEVAESMRRHPAGSKRHAQVVVADHDFVCDPRGSRYCAAGVGGGELCGRPEAAHRPCACGEPDDGPGSVHRTDGPCYSTEQAP